MQDALVVVVDDLFGVIYTAVTDFDSVAVKYPLYFNVLSTVPRENRLADSLYIYIYMYINVEVESTLA